MHIVLVMLFGLCVWLLAERQRLSDGVGSMESRLTTLEKEREQLQQRLQRNAEDPRTWLQKNIEGSTNGLDGSSRARLR
jgi:hypothetical protein